jgi:RNA polymerase sigma-70 factor (ECF subfamily)
VTLTVADSVGRLAAVRTQEEEFTAFYAGHYPELAGYCWSLTRDRELAHDLTQEAFARMVSRWRRIDDPKAYLYRVATNLVRKAWRDRADDRTRIDAVAADVRDSGQHHPGPDASLITLRTAVEALPRRLRDVVLLHYFADLSVDAVAGAVGRPAGTVKRQLSEARVLLANELEALHD